MREKLVHLIADSTKLPFEQVTKLLSYAKDSQHGDLSFPCFVLAKSWSLPPADCATRLASALTLPDEIDHAMAVGPYLNFFLRRDWLAQTTISHILQPGEQSQSTSQQQETIVIEYSSPNIAKPFHIGHLRTTLIGHSLDRIYRYLGYHVISVNHLGDWGTQFGFVWAGCTLWGSNQDASIFDLVNLYIRATTLRKQQEEGTVPPDDSDKPNINDMARAYFLRLEQNDPEAVKFWEWVLDISMSYLRKLYQRLGIHFDYFTGESFYRNKLTAIEQLLRDSGILEDSRGALGVDLGKKLGFVRIFAEDGRSLYITRDIAQVDYRYHTFHPQKILIVVGAPQTLHFQQLIGVLDKMKHPAANCVVHVSYGNVPGISTRASTGSGDRIWLNALIDEAHERALGAYRTQVDKRPEGLDEEQVAEAVGLGAICFNYLSRTNTKEFHFSWEEALNFQGDTGPYIQYALARINGIEAKAIESGLKITHDFDAKLLIQDEAYQLVALLGKFDEVVRRAASEYEPYHVALYVLQVARAVSLAYRSLRVVGEDRPVANARLALFRAARQVITAGLALIGVPPVDRM